ncbi:MAG TPA: IPT/TIG domain-containing protein [Acidobacteriaceae bacterium]|jgi:hypothetical protein|nr:IPT/TIG domain-containing protein [Acidobacteriaceae bacterium]
MCAQTAKTVVNQRRARRAGLLMALGLLMPAWEPAALAGGPRWVAGSSYFDPAAMGQPVIWNGGQVSYFTDLSALSPAMGNLKAVAMVGKAAAVWNGVGTAAVSIQSGGSLGEYVDGYYSSHKNALPADILPAATSKPVAVVFDQTGAIINAMVGTGESTPLTCASDGVIARVDNFTTSGKMAHALILVNGQCATNTAQIANVQYQLVRAFGLVLGLGWSQTNEEMFAANSEITNDGLNGWPVMHPMERLCMGSSGQCMLNGMQLRTDDLAAVNRLYSVTAANLGSWPGKTLTAAATISVQGTIAFPAGQGMQGVNVVLRPLVNGVPDVAYTATAVSGVYFAGNAGNPVTGAADASGNALNQWGSSDVALEGYFDLSGVPLPPGATSADYQLSFEAINPVYTGGMSVGPYTTGQVTPSGTMPVILLPGLSAGSAITQDVVVGDAADAEPSGADGEEATPANVPVNGEWTGRITGYGHAGWFGWWARGAREFTIEAQALDETGAATENKAQVVVGAWNGTDVVGALPVTGTVQPFNGVMPGLTALPVLTVADSEVRIGLADFRGDGRPDYAYRGRILYADSVTPTRVPPSGGQIVIAGMGFRPDAVVMVNGEAATVTSVTPTTIVAVAPASGGVMGTVAITIEDPQTQGVAAILGGFSYDAQGTDVLSLVAAPSGNVPLGVPEAFTVRVMDPASQMAAGGVTVTFQVTAGTAALGCGQNACSVVTAGDGTATLMVTANAATLTQMSAGLTNGNSVLTQFTGIAPPVITAMTPNLFVAMGATVEWPVETMVLSPAGAGMAGQKVTWTAAGAGVCTAASQSASGASGMASNQVTAGPFTESVASAVNACMAGTASCVALNVIPVQPMTEALTGWNGTQQYVAASQAFAPVTLRVVDAFGDPVAGASVMFAEAFYGWTEPCPVQGNCPPAPLLGQQSVTAISGIDGSVTITPPAANGLAGRLLVTAIAGTNATLNFELDAHP